MFAAKSAGRPRLVTRGPRRIALAATAARRPIAAGERGPIVNASSRTGHAGEVRRGGSRDSKAAPEGMTKAMPPDPAPQRIGVRRPCAAFVATPLARRFFGVAASRAAEPGRIGFGRIGRVGRPRGAILFLAGDASARVSGAPLLRDGGRRAG